MSFKDGKRFLFKMQKKGKTAKNDFNDKFSCNIKINQGSVLHIFHKYNMCYANN